MIIMLMIFLDWLIFIYIIICVSYICLEASKRLFEALDPIEKALFPSFRFGVLLKKDIILILKYLGFLCIYFFVVWFQTRILICAYFICNIYLFF